MCGIIVVCTTRTVAIAPLCLERMHAIRAEDLQLVAKIYMHIHRHE